MKWAGIGERPRMPAWLGGRGVLVMMGGLTFLASVAEAQSSAVRISVDATAPGVPIERVWAFHGYDEVNYTTMPEGRALLGALAAAHTAPVHVRSHFLFNTGDGVPAMKWGSTNVYTEDADRQPVFDWTLTDEIMDALTGAGAYPFVELGFMPKALSVRPNPYRNASSIGLNGGCFYPPTDYQRWGELVRAWAAHVDGRYPEVSTRWLWELWNEPDSGYWHGTFDEYAQLYDFTESALHAVLPAAALGGPAVIYPDRDFLTRFLDHCATGRNAVTGETGTRLDLVTFHAKGGVASVDGHARMDLGKQLRLHRAGFAAVAASPVFAKVPIYITEADPDGCAACPLGDDAAFGYRLSTAYGAYEVAMMKHTIDLADAMKVRLGGVLTWAFTFPGTPYFAGYRVLATNGIHLPVFAAFRLLGLLGGTRLPLASSGARGLVDILEQGVRSEPDIDGLATLDAEVIRILVWNYHDDVVAAQATHVQVSVRVPSSFGARVVVSHLGVDESHGDAYHAWLAQGSPQSPSTAQVAVLQQAMAPSSRGPDQTVSVAPDGWVEIALALPRFGISLVTLAPAPPGDGTVGGGATDAAGHVGPPASLRGGGCACGVAGGRLPIHVLLGIAVLAWARRARRHR